MKRKLFSLLALTLAGDEFYAQAIWYENAGGDINDFIVRNY